MNGTNRDKCNVLECPRHELSAKRQCTLSRVPQYCVHYCFVNNLDMPTGECGGGSP